MKRSLISRLLNDSLYLQNIYSTSIINITLTQTTETHSKNISRTKNPKHFLTRLHK